MTDFEYSYHDGFYSLFPCSDIARNTVNHMIAECGSNKLLPHEFREFKRGAHKAGYKIRQFRPKYISADDLAALLAGTEPR